MTFLGVAAILLGITNMMKAVDATATTMAALRSASSTTNMTMSDRVARPHWNR